MHNLHQKIHLFFAALFGATSIALAAAGSHAFHDELVANDLLSAFQKGIDYAMYHALALLGVVVLQQMIPLSKWHWVGYVWIMGTLCFAGGLFLHSLLQLHQFVPIVPVGGVMLILGWLLLGLLALLQKTS